MTSPGPKTQPPPRGRGNPSFGDILRSMGVIALIILGLWLVGNVVYGRDSDPPRSQDYRSVVEQVAPTAELALVAPGRLPDDWSATSVRYTRPPKEHWHLGVLTNEEEYVGLEQTGRSPAAMVDEYAPQTQPDGTATVAGERWTVRTGGDETTFVRDGDGTTTLVTGTADRGVIEDFIASLEPTTQGG